MAKSLGGATFCWRGNDQDYHFKETLISLVELCDQVAIAAGGPDGTFEDVETLIRDNNWNNVILIKISQEMWDGQHGPEKLSYFSNIAIGQLTTDWCIYIQSDEILHEESYPYIRIAIEDTEADGYFLRRLNLWKSPLYMLNVIQERKPCSTEVIRLAKTQFRCFDDAESLAVSGMVGILGDIDHMQIYHTGFVREGKKHLVKIKHMLTEVFGWGNDKRAENCDTFIPERFFSDADIIPIPRPLPKLIQAWAKERYPDLTPL